MHNKFCIIDGKKLITGSYNWTYAAEYNNKENIIISDDISLCNEFSFHFKSLKENISKTKNYVQVGYESHTFATYSKYEELSEELFFMQDNNIAMNNGEEADTLISRIQSYKEEYVIYNHNRENKYVLTDNIGIKSKDDKMLMFLRKGTPLPTLKTKDTVTVENNQKDGDADIYFGAHEKVNENTPIGTVPMPDIPQRKAGEVKFRDTIFVDTDGHIHYSFICLNDGRKASGSFECPEIARKI